MTAHKALVKAIAIPADMREADKVPVCHLIAALKPLVSQIELPFWLEEYRLR